MSTFFIKDEKENVDNNFMIHFIRIVKVNNKKLITKVTNKKVENKKMGTKNS